MWPSNNQGGFNAEGIFCHSTLKKLRDQVCSRYAYIVFLDTIFKVFYLFPTEGTYWTSSDHSVHVSTTAQSGISSFIPYSGTDEKST